jgi:hypothetical protein
MHRLDSAPGLTPAQLPPRASSTSSRRATALKGATFTPVGYGAVRDDKTGGPHALFSDGVRRFTTQS